MVNTRKGLFPDCHFVSHQTLGIFQRVIDNVLQGNPGVVAYLADILVTNVNDQKHLAALGKVLIHWIVLASECEMTSATL